MNLNTILVLGIILLLGLVSSNLIRKIKMPSITAYLLLGILLGPYFLGIINEEVVNASDFISNIVLSIIAFSIGQNFSKERFREIGNIVIAVTLGEGLCAFLFVTSAIYFLTDKPFFIAIIFGAISTATAPAAVVMIVREFRARGKFTDTLLGVVAMDDGLGLILFALIIAVAKSMTGMHGAFFSTALTGITHGILEIFGAILIGFVLGWILSIFSKHITNKTELLIYSLGFVLFNAGLSIFFGFSLLLANMAMAGVVININKTGFKFFESIRSVDTPLYVIFFVLAGSNLEINYLKTMGLIGIIYIIARMFGKIIGVFISSIIIDAPKTIRKYLGMGLAPQAGIALGMAMVIKGMFPEEGSFIMSTIIATTVIYEIIGPFFTKIALEAAGNIKK